MVEAVPVLVPGSGPAEAEMSEILVLPGQALPEGQSIPEAVRQGFAKARREARTSALQLGQVAWWRGRRIVPVQLVPLLHDGGGRAGQVLRRGEWEIVFVPDEKAAAGASGTAGAKLTAQGDGRFDQVFLNRELLDRTLTEAAWGGGSAKAAPGRILSPSAKTDLLAPEVRIGVKATKLQRVTAARLRERRFLPEAVIAEDEIRLYQRRYLGEAGQGTYVEIEVPILMVGDGGAFAGDDYFLFYGLRPRDDGQHLYDLGDGPVQIPGCGDPQELNNDVNIYWLAAATPEPGKPWARMRQASLPPASGVGPASYRRFEHHEEQVDFRENNFLVTSDRLYQNYFNDDQAVIPIEPLWSADPAGSDAVIKVGFTGFSIIERGLNFDLLIDGVQAMNLASDLYLASMMAQTESFTVPAGVLQGGKAEVVMTEKGGSDLMAYLNWATISYDALYRARDNRLVFPTGGTTGPRPIRVTGFTSADIGLVEITDPRAPVYLPLQAQNIVAENEGWTLSINADLAGSERTFTASGDWTGQGVPEFAYTSTNVATDPHDPTVPAIGDPDLIVIAHRTFSGAIGRWIDHRRARAGGELKVHLVDVQDVYDHYSGGMKDPWAIKRFAAEAVNRWGSWALMLVGDANENARGLGVPATALGWSTDFVPAHYHVQWAGSGYQPELMATDKWYATSQAGMHYPQEDFPAGITAPWEMYVGRFPCNSIGELDVMIDKVIAVESTADGQTWRRRGVFFADDAWSNGYGLDALKVLKYSPGEEIFASSTRDIMAGLWRGGTPVALEADTLFLANWLEPLWPQGPSEDRIISVFADHTEDLALQPLLQALNRGGLVAYYQGHANQYVLCSEYWIEDQISAAVRKDVSSLNNAGKPWLFFGMGCHISDWAQNTVSVGSNPKERSLSEKFMVRSGGGASATYGSSGFEYISANYLFSDKIFRRWILDPPWTGRAPLPGSAAAPRSRWVAGELLWTAEADFLATLGGDVTYREMIAQYTLLGDPLMVMDAGPPQVVAAFADEPGVALNGEVVLEDADGTNLRRLGITARDEAGIDRLRYSDSTGGDLGAQYVTEELPEGAKSHQEVFYLVDVPIRPFAHVMSLEVFDTGAPLPADRHWRLDLVVKMDAEILAAGQPHDPAVFTFTPEVPVDFVLAITSSSTLTESAQISLGSENLELAGLVIQTTGPRSLEVRFTATATVGPADALRSVHLDIQENGTLYPTVYVLQEGEEIPAVAGVGRVYSFPNPMADQTRFIFETEASGRGVIRVFSVAGRQVARIPFSAAGGEGTGIVEWDGRDDRGDELGNGTYLYRVELDGGSGTIVSDMQRLVVMR